MSRRTAIHTSFATAGLAAMSLVASAQVGPIQYVSQDRWVEASGFETDPETGKMKDVKSSVAAFGLEDFDILLALGNTGPPGVAQQTSILGRSTITAIGMGAGGKYLQQWWSLGHSEFSVTFAVEKPLEFEFSGFAAFETNGVGMVSLEGPSSSLVFAGTYSNPKVEFQETGILEAGEYTLFAIGTGGGNPGGSGRYSLTFDVAPPCIADCDGTGGLNIDDFVCFQTFYALGDFKADCDGDGELSIDDFVCFQTGYAAGC